MNEITKLEKLVDALVDALNDVMDVYDRSQGTDALNMHRVARKAVDAEMQRRVSEAKQENHKQIYEDAQQMMKVLRGNGSAISLPRDVRERWD